MKVLRGETLRGGLALKSRSEERTGLPSSAWLCDLIVADSLQLWGLEFQDADLLFVEA